MNADEVGSLVRQVATAMLSTGAAASYVSHDQVAALAMGLGTLVSVGWSVVAHWNMKKVPEGAMVVGGMK